jgi:hypothetical protein
MNGHLFCASHLICFVFSHQCFPAFLSPTLSLVKETLKYFFLSLGTPAYENVYRPESKGAVDGALKLLLYCELLDKNCRNVSRFLRIFRCISKFLCVYSTISRGTHKNVLRNPGWETLA